MRFVYFLKTLLFGIKLSINYRLLTIIGMTMSAKASFTGTNSVSNDTPITGKANPIVPLTIPATNKQRATIKIVKISILTASLSVALVT